MRDYLLIANNKVFFICGAILVLFITFQSLVYLRLAFKEGKRIGLTKEKMIKAFRTGVISTIVPTLAVIVALITMTPILGIPIPWMRLSIIGSAPYEIMAAGVGAKSMGIDTLGGVEYTAEVFASSIWIMCVGSIWAVLIVTFFLKKIKVRYSRNVETDTRWRTTLMNAAFLGVFAIFMADPITTGGLPLGTMLSGASIMTFFAILIIRYKQKWLKEFALAFSMIGAMLCSILFTNFFKL